MGRVVMFRHVPGHLLGGVSYVHDHAQAVHLPDDLSAEGGETVVPRLLGLDIGDGVDVVVDELDRADSPVVGLLDAVDAFLQEVGALGGEEGAGPARSLGTQDIRGT